MKRFLLVAAIVAAGCDGPTSQYPTYANGRVEQSSMDDIARRLKNAEQWNQALDARCKALERRVEELEKATRKPEAERPPIDPRAPGHPK